MLLLLAALFPKRVPLSFDSRPMTKLDFGEAVDLILNEDPRYEREAYYFLRDALDYTMKVRKKAKEVSGHVSGQQLLEGIRQYALKEFGPMVPTVLDYWRVKRGEDFGEMVFSLIAVGIFGKTDRDSKDDFKDGFTFQEAFVAPFLPKAPEAPSPVAANEPAEGFR